MRLQFMWLATYERRVPDSLCSPLICCRTQGKRTDYCKVRIEVSNLFPGEKKCTELVKAVSITSVKNTQCHVMTPHFFDVYGQHGDNNFFRKFYYNLLIEIIWGRFFSSLHASLLGGIFRVRAS